MAISADDPLYDLQSSRYKGIRGNVQKPVCAVVNRAEGKVLENQVRNLRWASELLGVRYDEGAKDITRVFFTTTASADDLLFLDEALFAD